MTENELLQLFLNHTRYAQLLVDQSGSLVKMNTFASRLFNQTNASNSEIKEWSEIQDNLPSFNNVLSMLTANGYYDEVVLLKNNHYYQCEYSPIFDMNDQIEYVLITCIKMHGKAYKDKEILKDEFSLNIDIILKNLENEKVGLILIDDNGNIKYTNDILYQECQIDKAHNVTNIFKLKTTVCNDFITQISKTLLEGESWRGLIHLNNKKSSEQIYTVSINKFEAEGNQVYYIITYINNSKEVELEKQLRQAKKLETIGALTGGISHEFNNILTPIMGFAELITYDVDETSSIYDSAEQIIKSSMRAKDLISQILTFSRQREVKHQPVNMVPLVKEAIKLLRAAIPSNVTIKSNIQCKNDKVLGDPSQIHQLIMNLYTNSLNAVKDSGGEINLLITQSFISQNPQGYPEFEPGEFICIEISDTGNGLPEAIVDQINDPDFTVKGSDEDTYLGLAMVHSIVKAMQGFIRVDSTYNMGTIFYIYLPNYLDQKNHTSSEMQIYTGNRQKILFIDDELPILKVMEQILDKLNYQTTCFSESDKALKEYLDNQDKYDLIITDYYMPKMTGIDIIQELRNQSLNVPIVLSTGYSEYLTNESIEKYQITDYVSKPISIYELSKKLYNIFNNGIFTEEE